MQTSGMSSLNYSVQNKFNNNYTKNNSYIKPQTLQQDIATFSTKIDNKPSFKGGFFSKILRSKNDQEYYKKSINTAIERLRAGEINEFNAISKIAKLKYEYTKENFSKVTKQIKSLLPKELQGMLEARAKSYDSIYNKLNKKYQKELEEITTKADTANKDKANALEIAIDGVEDLIGMRFNLKDASPNTIQKVVKIFTKPLANNLKITEIENHHGEGIKPYLNQVNSTHIKQTHQDAKIIFNEKKSGYTGTNILFNNGMEIQLKSKKMTDFGNGEHKAVYKPEGKLGTTYKNLSDDLKQQYAEYRKECFGYLRKLDSKEKAQKPVLPKGIPAELGIDNLIKVGSKTD